MEKQIEIAQIVREKWRKKKTRKGWYFLCKPCTVNSGWWLQSDLYFFHSKLIQDILNKSGISLQNIFRDVTIFGNQMFSKSWNWFPSTGKCKMGVEFTYDELFAFFYPEVVTF